MIDDCWVFFTSWMVKKITTRSGWWFEFFFRGELTGRSVSFCWLPLLGDDLKPFIDLGSDSHSIIKLLESLWSSIYRIKLLVVSIIGIPIGRKQYLSKKSIENATGPCWLVKLRSSGLCWLHWCRSGMTPSGRPTMGPWDLNNRLVEPGRDDLFDVLPRVESLGCFPRTWIIGWLDDEKLAISSFFWETSSIYNESSWRKIISARFSMESWLG